MSEITSPTLLIPKITIITSGSSLNTFQSCPTKDYLENERLLRPYMQNVAIDKGTLMHKILETYYKFIQKGLPNPVDAAIIAGRKLVIDLDLPIGEGEEVISHFIQYVDFYKGDGWTPLFVEESFSVVIYEDSELRILYEGTIDLVIENVQSLRIVVDHKTGSRNKIPLSLSNQFLGYATALDTNMVLINKILFYKTDKEPKDKFRRYPINYTDRQLKEWKDQAIQWSIMRYSMHKLNKERKEEGKSIFYPMNLTSCDKYGKCIYTPICSSVPGDSREYTISQQYKVIEQSHDEDRFRDDD